MRTEKCEGNQINCHNPGSSQKLKNGDRTQNTMLRTSYVLPSVLYTNKSLYICTHNALLQ